MNKESIAIAVKTEQSLQKLPQLEQLTTWHTLHAGIYSRTVHLKAGEAIVGALIKVPTTLTIAGDMKVYIGNEVRHVEGFTVIAASQHRKQVMYAIKDTFVTMSFCTTAQTIEEAEDEFTDESDKLMSRDKNSINIIQIGD